MEDVLDLPDIFSADDVIDGAPAAVPADIRSPAGVLKQVAAPAMAVAVTSPAPAAVVATVKETVLALFRATEPGLNELAERYRAVAYDVKTPKGMKDAKAARHDLRENGRYAVQRAEDAIKKELNGVKPIMAAEASRLIGIVKPIEDAIDGQITVREAEIEAEKAEKARLEQVAQDENAARCTKLTDTIAKAEGKTSAQIANAIAHIEALTIPLEKWGNRADFVAAGEAAKVKTLAALRRLQIEAKTAEDNAALRAENERLAAELRERQRIADEAEAARQAERDVAARAEQEKAAAEAEEVAKAAEVERLAQLVAAAPPTPVVAEPPAAEPAPTPAPVASAPAPMKWEPRFRAPAAFTAPAPQPEANAEAGAVTELADEVEPLAALLAHIAKAFERFPSNPKVTSDWWADLRRLAAEVKA